MKPAVNRKENSTKIMAVTDSNSCEDSHDAKREKCQILRHFSLYAPSAQQNVQWYKYKSFPKCKILLFFKPPDHLAKWYLY